MQPGQYIRIIGHRENVRDFIVDDRYLFSPTVGKTPEQDLIAWLQRMAFRFLKWSNGLIHPIDRQISYTAFTINTDDFMRALLQQQHEVFEYGVEPRRCIMGASDFEKLMGLKGVERYLSFDTSYRVNRPPDFMGLRVEVVPWMKGVLLLP